MDALTLARLQFGITTVYHFFFVPLTLGLSIIVAIMQTIYVRSGDEKYKRMAKFWGKLLLINFAMGVVTGIVQEFQFGMNWSEYSRFVGDIFGAPLAVEALVAFFIESTFLGVWIFGWDKLSKRVHLASIWLVAFASNMSAFWILVANSFMQNPVGYRIAESGRAEMTDFIALITNPNVWLQFPHVAFGGLATGAFFVIGISAFHLLRNKSGEEALEPFRASMRLALIIGTFASIPLIGFGHAQGQRMADVQPMKLAAAEGLWNSEDPASLSMFQIGDETNRREIINIRIPSLLSFLAYNTPDGLVQGMNQLQERYVAQYGEGNYVPPMIWLIYWSFRAMVGAGVVMAILGFVGLFLFYTGRLNASKARTFLTILVAALFLPYIASISGWMLTEVGRQPWIVQGLMTIEEALSPNVTVDMLFISLVGFAVLYGLLMAADIYLLQKYARRNMDDSDTLTPWLDKPTPAIDQQPRLEGAY
ncbi:MAG: cytochrome ubiquinol oxidase subunit I [Anaerolineae bacterium]|nr:cytochrome ubiquinol oxidase subunit I [Anaerolineae bacterium]MDW8173850.1 cytochrome ubiquinol oxidase subunit I [Anaerolineae bacterium]